MADAFVELQSQDNARDLSHAEWLALLLGREAAKRDTSRFQTRLRSAKLRHSQASIQDVDYRAARRLDKAMFQQLATGRWIAEHRNVLVTQQLATGRWIAEHRNVLVTGKCGILATSGHPDLPKSAPAACGRLLWLHAPNPNVGLVGSPSISGIPYVNWL
jgi:DNA replication protein DnaC